MSSKIFQIDMFKQEEEQEQLSEFEACMAKSIRCLFAERDIMRKQIRFLMEQTKENQDVLFRQQELIGRTNERVNQMCEAR